MAKSKVTDHYGKRGYIPVFPGGQPFSHGSNMSQLTIYDSVESMKRHCAKKPTQYAYVEVELRLKDIQAVKYDEKKPKAKSGANARTNARTNGSQSGTVKRGRPPKTGAKSTAASNGTQSKAKRAATATRTTTHTKTSRTRGTVKSKSTAKSKR